MSTSLAQYNPQSPTPHSPPRTPSPSLDDQPHTRHSDSTIPLDTPATTPDAPPRTSSTYKPLSRRGSERSVLSGMGITFPPESNPLPSELAEGPTKKSEGSIEMAKSASEGPEQMAHGMAATWSNGGSDTGGGGGIYGQTGFPSLQPTPARPRSHSPIPPDGQSNGFASSSSLYGGSGLEHRERVVSPTKPRFDSGSNEQLPLLNSDSAGIPSALLNGLNPLMSPAIDGKKEPSIKPPPYDPNLYAYPGAKNRSRSPFPPTNVPNGKTEYSTHPLTSQAYNQTTAREGGQAGAGFYDSAAYWLCLYFFFNLGLTLFNKIVLVSFPFPYTLTGLHALSGCAGTYFALERGAFVPARLTQKESLILGAFSVLYTINIAVSNISLQLVTIPFHQVVRASTPLFTIIISTVILRTRFSLMKLVSLLPVVAGVGFATYGDYYFTAWGLILTLLGTFLAALKTVVTNLIQTGGGQRLKLHPMDLLMRMSPLAFIQCVVYGWYTGELDRVRRYGATQMTRSKAIALLVNGVIAFGLNIVSFTANKKAGALTMTVSANCKQVLTIALAVLMFDLHISPTNGIGILLTLIGGGWYGYVEYTEKKKKSVKLVDRS